MTTTAPLRSPQQLYSPPGIDAAGILGIDEGALAQYGLGALTRRPKLIGVEL